jgi:hypothetical protein
MILINQAIVSLTINYKLESKRFVIDRKRVVVGRKLGIIPIFEEKDYVFQYNGEPFSSVENFTSARLYIEDGRVYFKPHCVIHMSDKTEHRVFFEDTGSLWKYKDDLLNQLGGHIDLKIT